MLIKLSTWSYLEIRMHDKVTKEIKCGLKSGDTCYHLGQNFKSSRLLSQNKDSDIQIYNFVCCF